MAATSPAAAAGVPARPAVGALLPGVRAAGASTAPAKAAGAAVPAKRAARPAGARQDGGEAARAPLGWDDFPVFVWREANAGEPLPEALVRAFGGALLLSGEEPALANGGAWIAFNAPGRDALHLDGPRVRRQLERWFETRDDALLVREPCLSDPRTLERLEERLAASLAALAGEGCLGVSLGDEVSLTPGGGPADWCLSPTCRERWRAFTEGLPDLSPEEREGLADLASITTDATRLALAEGRTEALGPWLLRRRFHHEVVLGALERLARRARGLAPATPVGILGLAGRSAFGNVAVDRVLRWSDFAEAYATGDARALLETLREPRQRTLTTVFLDPARPEAAAWQIASAWLRGDDGLVLWSDSALERSPELLERAAAAVSTARALRQAAPDFAPRPSGIALVHSGDSVAATWMRDALLDGPTWPRRLQGFQEEHGARERSQRGWLRLAEDSGLQPGSLPIEGVGAQTASGFALLILERVLVLSEEELRGLIAYAAAGGHLLVHGELGWVDHRGRRPGRPPLERLREAAPERVIHVEEEVAAYLDTRLRPGGTTAVWRERMEGWLAAAGIETAPWRMAGEGADLPWLCARSPLGDGWAWAAIPNIGPELAAGVLRDLELAVEPAEGWTLEWIHPPPDGEGARTLPSGDAAFFRLLPRRE